MAFHVNYVDGLVQLEIGVGRDDRRVNGDPVGIVKESLVESGFPPGRSLELLAYWSESLTW